VVTGAVLTVTAMASGSLGPYQVLYRADGTPFATVTGYLTGRGGVGTYSISQLGTIASEAMTSSMGNIACFLDNTQTAMLDFSACGTGQVEEFGDIEEGQRCVYDLKITEGSDVSYKVEGHIVLDTRVSV
jgi:hypothetical protein